MIAQTATTSKPDKAFFAHLYDEAGVLTKSEGILYFLHEATGAVTEIEPADCTFLTVLGEVGVAECQQVMDRVHGGYAKIATTRVMGVA